MTDGKAVIKKNAMSEDMQQDAVDCATDSGTWEIQYRKKDIAAFKKEFDKN